MKHIRCHAAAPGACGKMHILALWSPCGHYFPHTFQLPASLRFPGAPARFPDTFPRSGGCLLPRRVYSDSVFLESLYLTTVTWTDSLLYSPCNYITSLWRRFPPFSSSVFTSSSLV